MRQAFGAAPVQSQKEREEPETRDASAFEAPAVVRHLAHELRQPLSTIESIAYYLEIVLPPQDRKVRFQVEKLQQLVQQASWILSDAVDYLQASPPSPQTIDLGEFLTEAVRDADHGGEPWVTLELSPQPALVRLDPEQAKHLLRNLLFFFRQMSKPEPEVVIRTGRMDEGVWVEFSAAGADCTAADLEEMFQPFSPHLPAGSGLALASVRRIVEVHHGRMDIRFEAPDTLRLAVVLQAG
jgi:signal transduction histidine kinase